MCDSHRAKIARIHARTIGRKAAILAEKRMHGGNVTFVRLADGQDAHQDGWTNEAIAYRKSKRLQHSDDAMLV